MGFCGEAVKITKEIGMIRVIVLIAAMFAAFQSQAASIEAGSPACISSDLFDQLTQAVTTQDEHSASWLAKNGCVITRKEFPVTVLSRDLSGVWKVRAYADNGVVLELWAPKDRIKE